ncbi:hypothetical protein JAAARDRAFT_197639 [Jaapia argillacea MUCL 33604]|uniref:C2H2-type domain-containing protein n=1 Tax=Jaapia argillacea MUCL 33604 TaxID=933084 RepID=A0A067PS43_9AGAM|nr:hypothetical protein JAAARDRAFT_197639 [Jaapia argillacea MUCL 33604]
MDSYFNELESTLLDNGIRYDDQVDSENPSYDALKTEPLSTLGLANFPYQTDQFQDASRATYGHGRDGRPVLTLTTDEPASVGYDYGSDHSATLESAYDSAYPSSSQNWTFPTYNQTNSYNIPASDPESPYTPSSADSFQPTYTPPTNTNTRYLNVPTRKRSGSESDVYSSGSNSVPSIHVASSMDECGLSRNSHSSGELSSSFSFSPSSNHQSLSVREGGMQGHRRWRSLHETGSSHLSPTSPDDASNFLSPTYRPSRSHSRSSSVCSNRSRRSTPYTSPMSSPNLDNYDDLPQDVMFAMENLTPSSPGAGPSNGHGLSLPYTTDLNPPPIVKAQVSTPAITEAAMSRRQNPARWQCEFCNSSFTRRNNLIGHQTAHRGEKPHACDKCDKAFARPSDLNRHRKNVHEKRGAASGSGSGGRSPL